MPGPQDRGGEQGRRLRALRARHGLSQEDLAERILVSRQSVTHYEGGGAIPEEIAARLRELFPSDLQPGAENLRPVVARVRPTLPFAGNVPTSETWGEPLDGEEPIEVEPEFVGPRRYVGRVVGSSCYPALRQGDETVWEHDHAPRPGVIVLAQRKGDHGCTVKQLVFDDTGQPRLAPVNPESAGPEDGEGWGVVARLVGVTRHYRLGPRHWYVAKGITPDDLED